MRAAWATVQLGEVLAPVVRDCHVDPSQEYPLLGVRLDGQGPFHRETVLGTQTSASRLYEVKAGDFIYSRLFAWRGAFGLIEPELDGHFVSNEFPTFAPRDSRIDPKYLRYWFRLPDVLRRVEADCSGSTPLTRNRYKEQYFCALEIPLPPLTEQRRIVARIEELAAKVEKARDLRSKSAGESQSLLSAACENMLIRASASAPIRKLSSLVDPDRGISYGIVQTGTEFEGGIPTLRAGDLQWFHVNTNGVKLVDPAIERGYLRTRLQGGELLLRIRGGVGELAVCPESMAGGNVSREIAVIPLADQVVPRFAMFLLSARSSQAKMHGSVRGTSYLGINLKDVRELEIPVPTVSKQWEMLSDLESLKDKLDTLARLQGETRDELDAMLPAILDKAFKGEL